MDQTKQIREMAAPFSEHPNLLTGRLAVFGDIHGHMEGLQNVLDDIARNNCDVMLCLGDLVDGGASNDAVVQLVRDLNIPTVRGNHDDYPGSDISHENAQFLLSLPESIRTGDLLFTHISPREKKLQIRSPVEAWNVFQEVTFHRVFVGHVHVPSIYGEKCDEFGSSTTHPITPGIPFQLDAGDRYILNPGPIGYGRRGWNRIVYSIYDTNHDTIEFRTVDGPMLNF